MDYRSFSRKIGHRVAVSFAVAAITGFFGSAIADDGTAHRGELQRPIPLGVSGSSIEFLEINGSSYCYAGTLGALVEDSQNADLKYVVSNNHVLARENAATIGEPVIQPGLLDENGDPTSCSADTPDYTVYEIGSLSDYEPINFKVLPVGRPDNTIDAAIAQVTSDTVMSDGAILDIGVINPVTLPAAVDMTVMKSGRTTGLTHGVVAAVDVSIAVGYSSGYGLYKNQIRIVSADPGSAFILGGDSGSVLVTDPADGTDPQAVGLLFAGNETGSDAFANPIDDVLAAFGVKMAGCSVDPNCAGGGGGGGGNNGGGGGKKGGGGRPTAGFEPIGLDLARQAKERHEEELLRTPGVVGTGIGADVNGNAVIEIYVKGGAKKEVGQPIPDTLDGVPVRVIETGEIKAR